MSLKSLGGNPVNAVSNKLDQIFPSARICRFVLDSFKNLFNVHADCIPTSRNVVT